MWNEDEENQGWTMEPRYPANNSTWGGASSPCDYNGKEDYSSDVMATQTINPVDVMMKSAQEQALTDINKYWHIYHNPYLDRYEKTAALQAITSKYGHRRFEELLDNHRIKQKMDDRVDAYLEQETSTDDVYETAYSDVQMDLRSLIPPKKIDLKAQMREQALRAMSLQDLWKHFRAEEFSEKLNAAHSFRMQITDKKIRETIALIETPYFEVEDLEWIENIRKFIRLPMLTSWPEEMNADIPREKFSLSIENGRWQFRFFDIGTPWQDLAMGEYQGSTLLHLKRLLAYAEGVFVDNIVLHQRPGTKIWHNNRDMEFRLA